MSTDQHPVSAHIVRLDQHDKDLDHITARVQRLVDGENDSGQRLALLEAQGAHFRETLAELKQLVSETKSAVEDGFKAANGRTRKLEISVAVMRWALGLVGIVAGALFGVVLRRLFGGG